LAAVFTGTDTPPILASAKYSQISSGRLSSMMPTCSPLAIPTAASALAMRVVIASTSRYEYRRPSKVR
jgi:hypothetical protein